MERSETLPITNFLPKCAPNREREIEILPWGRHAAPNFFVSVGRSGSLAEKIAILDKKSNFEEVITG
jgi:hypothetical protein